MTTPITNLSRKSAEAQIQRRLQMTQNMKNLDPMKYASDRANQGVKGNTRYTPRNRAKNEAMPPSADLFKRATYRLGDGEVVQQQRPGSDHSHIKSLINHTPPAIYRDRGHA